MPLRFTIAWRLAAVGLLAGLVPGCLFSFPSSHQSTTTVTSAPKPAATQPATAPDDALAAQIKEYADAMSEGAADLNREKWSKSIPVAATEPASTRPAAKVPATPPETAWQTPPSTATPASPSRISITPVPANASEPLVATTNPKAVSAMGAVTATVPTESTPLSEPTLESLLPLLQKRADESLNPLSYAVAHQLIQSAETNQAPDPAALHRLSPADRRIVSELTAAVQKVALRSAEVSVAQRTQPLFQLAQRWQAESDLTLPTLVLASRVDSYGVYTPLDPKFHNGKRHAVIIYCEVDHFTSQRTEDGMFLTHLTQQDTLITEDGLLVWRPNPEDVLDRSRNLRRDFYLVKKLTLPESLAVGKYTLRMSVTDKLSNKIAVLTLPLEITSTSAPASVTRPTLSSIPKAPNN